MPFKTRFVEIPDGYAKFVRATNQADSDHAHIKKQANELVRDCKTYLQALVAIHDFISSLPQGYDDESSNASQILFKGRGQCNTKTTLFIALARAVGLPCRIHAWRVFKTVHKQHMNPIVYTFTPDETLFTYPEIYYKGAWKLLSEVLTKKNSPNWNVCPFDDGNNRKHPLKDEWIAKDLGSFWHPDNFYKKFGTNSSGWRKLAFPIAKLLLNKK